MNGPLHDFPTKTFAISSADPDATLACIFAKQTSLLVVCSDISDVWRFHPVMASTN
jgi:hypothetical protein